MGRRPLLRCSCLAVLLVAAGCRSFGGAEPTGRGVAPAAPVAPRGKWPDAPARPGPAVGAVRIDPARAGAALASIPTDAGLELASSGPLRIIAATAPKLRPPVLICESDTPLEQRAELPPVTEPPGALPELPNLEPVAPVVAAEPVAPVAPATPQPPAQPEPVSPGDFLPPIPALPDVAPNAPSVPPAIPAPMPARTEPGPTALPPPAVLPPLGAAPAPPPGVVAGPIDLNGAPMTFDALSKLVDGPACSSCGGGGAVGGCSTCGACGDVPCRSGGKRCEPFPATTAAGRVIGLIYSSVCCPDPCYQPKWEPLADAAFFTDAVRPKSSTRFRWDYGSHFAYPDRGEFFFARADGNGRGPKAIPQLRAIPYVDYHELSLITEVGMGNAGVQIAVPYRSVNSTPFGADGAGFSDMSITAKTMLLDSELALFGFQMRTYIPIGQTGKGLGTGHVSLEPGLNFGLRCSPDTYLQAQVVEWIPLGGDKDYQGAHLRWGTSLNHVLWRPTRDVQLVGTLESTGISFQDGLFTDPALGPQRLAKRTSATIGPGLRLFFCDTFDMGVGYQHGITGKYLIRDQMRLEFRYRY